MDDKEIRLQVVLSLLSQNKCPDLMRICVEATFLCKFIETNELPLISVETAKEINDRYIGEAMRLSADMNRRHPIDEAVPVKPDNRFRNGFIFGVSISIIICATVLLLII